jgi:AcrR family transcriptional regulator
MARTSSTKKPTPKPAAKSGARKAGPRTAAPKGDTRQLILAATIATLNEDGIVGCSARAIARRADVNQALIFYYYSSVEQTIIEAVGGLVADQHTRYAARLDEATSLVEVVGVATALHDDDALRGSMGVLVQAIAGVAHKPALSKQLGARLAPWFELIERTIVRVMGDSPAATLVSSADLSVAINALFLGSELFATIDPDLVDNTRLYASLRDMAVLADMLAGPAGTIASPARGENPTPLKRPTARRRSSAGTKGH